MSLSKPQALTTQTAGEDVQQQELSLIAGRKAEGRSRLNRQFGGFLQNQTYSSILSTITLPRICPKGWKLVSTPKPAQDV